MWLSLCLQGDKGDTEMPVYDTPMTKVRKSSVVIYNGPSLITRVHVGRQYIDCSFPIPSISVLDDDALYKFTYLLTYLLVFTARRYA